MHLRELRTAGHAPSLVAALLHFDVSFMAWVLLGALGAYIGEDLGLSASAKGLLVAVPLLSAAVFRVALGLLGDRYGPRRVGLISMAFVVVALITGWQLANTYGALLGVGVLLGVAGASFAIALPLAGRHYPPERQGLAMGIAGAGNSGTVLTTLFAPRLAEAYGWHAVFGLALIPVTLVWVAFALLAKEPPAPAVPVRPRDLRNILRERDAWRLCGLYAVTFGTFVGLASFLPIFFRDQYAISKVDAATLVAVGAALGSLLRPLGGYLADRVGGTTVLTGVYGVGAALLLFTSALPALGATATAFILAMGTFGVGNGAVFQLVGVRYRDRIGVLTGLVGAAGGLGGFFLPTILGTVKDVFGSFGPGLGRDRRRRGHRPDHHDPTVHRRAGGSPGMRVLVVGGGIAGQAVLEAIRERDSDIELTLACAEPRLPYDRVALSTLLASGADPDTLTLRPASWFEDHHIEVLLDTRVEELTGYDRYVICTGSDALVPPIPGAQHAHVFRGPEDCAAITEHAHGKAVVIGGGLLGLEAAYGLASLGCETTVVHLMDRLMERQLDQGAATLLTPAMEQLGVQVLLERNTEEIRPDGVRLAGGEELPADVVVISVGIRPQVDLARAVGLQVERGIVVDDAMVTSDPRVLAVGECAQHRGVVHGIVAPIHEQAKVAADTICGLEAAYTAPSPPRSSRSWASTWCAPARPTAPARWWSPTTPATASWSSTPTAAPSARSCSATSAAPSC